MCQQSGLDNRIVSLLIYMYVYTHPGWDGHIEYTCNAMQRSKYFDSQASRSIRANFIWTPHHCKLRLNYDKQIPNCNSNVITVGRGQDTKTIN